MRLEYKADEHRYEKMEYRRAGRSGLLLSKLSFGLWHNFGKNGDFENMREMCRAAFDRGVTSFDLANNYGPPYGSAEENYGRILDADFRPYRDELVIATKAGYDMWPGPYGNWGSRKYLTASLDQSLRRMKLEYVDIFYHHRMDPETPLEETLEALADIVRSGKALYAGVSNYNGDYTVKAAKYLRKLHCPFIVNQRRYSLLDRKIERDGAKDACREQGLGIVAFSPLAQGILTGKYIDGIPGDSRIAKDGRYLHPMDAESRRESVTRLKKIADDMGTTLSALALSWLLRDPAVSSVLIGASNPAQLIGNIEDAGSVEFTDDVLEEIDRITAEY